MIATDWFALIGASLSVVSIAAVSLTAQNAMQRLKKVDIKARYLEQQLKIATTGAIGMGHRILALEEKLNHLTEEDSITQEGDNFAYTQAKQMFDQGADTETVASNCGFSSSEAQLMALVQKRQKEMSKAKA